MARLAYERARVAGVELGGTKCICTLGYGPGEIEDQISLPTGTPDTTLSAIAAQLARWSDGSGFAALGIGSFGPLDLDPHSSVFGRVQQTAKPGWTGADVLGGIAQGLDLPLRFDTDVNAAAHAEQRWGAGRSARGLAYVTVGTGIGVGFANAGDTGAPHAHAELGHIRVVRQGGDERASVCPYHADCAEGLASGRAISSYFDGICGPVAPEDPRWAAPIDYLAQLCHAVMCLGTIDRIAFGGGVIMGNPGLIEAIEAAMRRSLNGYLKLPDYPVLVEAELGAQAGPLGSLALAHDALIERGSNGGAVIVPAAREVGRGV